MYERQCYDSNKKWQQNQSLRSLHKFKIECWSQALILTSSQDTQVLIMCLHHIAGNVPIAHGMGMGPIKRGGKPVNWLEDEEYDMLTPKRLWSNLKFSQAKLKWPNYKILTIGCVCTLYNFGGCTFLSLCTSAIVWLWPPCFTCAIGSDNGQKSLGWSEWVAAEQKQMQQRGRGVQYHWHWLDSKWILQCSFHLVMPSLPKKKCK